MGALDERLSADVVEPRTARAAVRRRLMPLYAAVFLQNLAFWVPIEKLFMTSIGFDAAGVGLMAAVYAAVVPLFEVPSGLLADRWSRRGVLVLAAVAAAVSVALGGLSQDVPLYLISAAFLGLFFALQSGTLESTVYDTSSSGRKRTAGNEGAPVTGTRGVGCALGSTTTPASPAS